MSIALFHRFNRFIYLRVPVVIKRFTRGSCAGILLVALLPQVTLAADTAEPAAVVEKLHTALLDVMKRADQLGYSGRYAALDPVVRETFDIPSIATRVIGPYWSSFDASLRQVFIDTLTKLATATYAREFDSFSDQRFQHVQDAQLKDDTVMVKTKLVESNGEIVPLDYVVRNKRGQWRIVDVVADGVRDVALKRADYASVLEREGSQGLLARLTEKTTLHDETPAH